MGQNERSLRKLWWRVLALLILAGGFFLVTPPRAALADACMDAYNVCISNCHSNPDCMYTCVHDADVNGCFATDDMWKCDDNFSTCRDIGGLGAASDEGDCFDIYASCQYGVADASRSNYMRLQGNDLDPDDPCLVQARSDYYSCLDGGNSLCLSQVDSSVVGGCCEGEFHRAWAACYGNYGQ